MVESCGQRSARTTWVPNGDNRAPILTYTLQTSTSFEKGSWTDVGEEMPANTQAGNRLWADVRDEKLANTELGNRSCTDVREEMPEKSYYITDCGQI